MTSSCIKHSACSRAVAQRCPHPRMHNLISIGGQHQGVLIFPYATSPAVGLPSRFPPFPYFPKFPTLSKPTLTIEHHVYIWQVSPQLSCSGTCQIRTLSNDLKLGLFIFLWRIFSFCGHIAPLRRKGGHVDYFVVNGFNNYKVVHVTTFPFYLSDQLNHNHSWQVPNMHQPNIKVILQ